MTVNLCQSMQNRSTRLLLAGLFQPWNQLVKERQDGRFRKMIAIMDVSLRMFDLIHCLSETLTQELINRNLRPSNGAKKSVRMGTIAQSYAVIRRALNTGMFVCHQLKSLDESSETKEKNL